MPNKIPDKANFQEALEEFFRESEIKKYPNRDLKARDLHFRAAGKFPSDDNNRVPLCCAVMRENMQLQLGDKILHTPPKGDGPRLEIRYVFPRTPPKSFPRDIWRECAFCDGTGQDPGDGNPMRGLCRACEGNKGKYCPEYWRRCRGKCGGKGRIPREPVGPFPNYGQCPDCDGIGWADPRRF